MQTAKEQSILAEIDFSGIKLVKSFQSNLLLFANVEIANDISPQGQGIVQYYVYKAKHTASCEMSCKYANDPDLLDNRARQWLKPSCRKGPRTGTYMWR